MAEVNLVSTLAMGVILLGIVVAISLVRDWRAAPVSAGGRPEVEGALDSTATWGVGFVAAALVLAVVAIAVVDGSFPAIGGGTALTLFLGLLGLVLVLFLGVGVYVSAVNRGLPPAMGAAMGVITVSSLILLAIVVQLLTAA